MIVGQGMVLAVLGVGIGFAGAIGLTRLLKSLLFEVKPTDPGTFVGVAVVLIGAALIASLVRRGEQHRSIPMWLCDANKDELPGGGQGVRK